MASRPSNESNASTPDKNIIRYPLKNDYMFRAVFQSRPKALEGLCRSLLRLSPSDSVHIDLKNPIQLGTAIDNKEFVLDLALTINDNLYLNLEMQLYNDGYWPERSLSYTCRSFDNLNRGAGYDEVLPVLHIGFLDFTLFPEHPEFVAEYKMMNTNPAHRNFFSDKFRISVVDLTQIERATDEDKQYDIDLWARVLTAKTWEEIDMLAQDNEYLRETSNAMYELDQDRLIRQQCQAREDFLYWERMKENRNKRIETELAETKVKLANKNAELANKNSELENQKAEIENQKAEIENQKTEIENQKAELAAKDARIAELLAHYGESNQ